MTRKRPEPDLVALAVRPPSAVGPVRLAGTVDQDGWLPTEAPGDVYALSWYPEDRIPPKHRAYVRRHVDRAARDLGLGPIRIRWFGPAIGDGEFYGEAPSEGVIPLGYTPEEQPMTVGLNKDLRGDMVAAVCAHEVRHVAQNLLRAKLGEPERREEDADGFAAAYILTHPDLGAAELPDGVTP